MNLESDSESEQSLQDSHANVLAIKNGDQSALGRLADSMRPYLKQVVRNELNNSTAKPTEDPSDIVQQTLVKAIQGVSNFQGRSLQEWRVWLAAIAKNEVRSAARYWNSQKRARQRTVQCDESNLVASGESPSAELKANELNSELAQAMDRLTESERQIISWRQIDGLSHADIADRLGISVEASRQRCKSAMDNLRKTFGKQA